MRSAQRIVIEVWTYYCITHDALHVVSSKFEIECELTTFISHEFIIFVSDCEVIIDVLHLRHYEEEGEYHWEHKSWECDYEYLYHAPHNPRQKVKSILCSKRTNLLKTQYSIKLSD